MNVFIEKFKNLDNTVQEFILKGFNQYIVDSGKCSSLRGVIMMKFLKENFPDSHMCEEDFSDIDFVIEE